MSQQNLLDKEKVDKGKGKNSFWENLEKQEKEQNYNISRNVLDEIVTEAFTVFDHRNDKTIDVRDFGYIIRSLGLNPSEAEIATLLEKMKDPESSKITLDLFKATMIRVLLSHSITRDSEAKIRKAFETLDMEKRGYLEPEKLAGLLLSSGEPFTNEEIEALFSTAVDPQRGVIFYKEYAETLAND